MKTKAEIDLKIYGVRGGTPKWEPNKGGVTVFIDNNTNITRDNYIHIDAFDGMGQTYGRREKSYIEIRTHHKNLFAGTFEELIKALSQK